MCRFFVLVMCFTMLSGCLRLGPEYHRPDIGLNIPDSFKNSSKKKPRQRLTSELNWDKLFPSLGVKRLIRQVRTGNWDLKLAAQKVMEAGLRLSQTKSDQFPELTLNASAQRQQRPVIGIIPGRSFSTKTNTFVLSAAASYELDLWGKIAKASEAAVADLMAAQENRRTVQLTVEAEVLTQFIKMGILQRRIQIASQSIENYEKMLKIIKSRYDRGLASLLDLQRARSALSQARAVIPELRKEMTQSGHQLSFLFGQYPETEPVRAIEPEYIKALPPIPPGLPSTLLLRRPDIRSAENRLRALNARIAVARANRFPQISLTGTYGYSSSELSVLVGPGSKLWSIAAGLIQPIFNAGKLKAEEEAAKARYEQQVAEYAKTVLRAFLEVENALVARRQELERRKKIAEFLSEARTAEKLAQNRYQRGLIDYLDLLEAQRSRFEAEDSLALVDLALLTNRVALVRALGGGWN